MRRPSAGRPLAFFMPFQFLTGSKHLQPHSRVKDIPPAYLKLLEDSIRESSEAIEGNKARERDILLRPW